MVGNLFAHAKSEIRFTIHAIQGFYNSGVRLAFLDDFHIHQPS
jgi:hypothetical protein